MKRYARAGAKSELAHLRRKVRQEAEAAIEASTGAATIVHVTLANCYARRLQEIGNIGTAA